MFDEVVPTLLYDCLGYNLKNTPLLFENLKAPNLSSKMY